MVAPSSDNPNVMGILATPPKATPPREIRPCWGTVNHWFPLIRPAIRALFLGGGTLGSHDNVCGPFIPLTQPLSSISWFIGAPYWDPATQNIAA